MTQQSEPARVDLGSEITLDELGPEAESLLPSLKTSEFEHPTGDEVPLPDALDDPTSIFERIIDESDFLPVWFLERGAIVQRAIARVVLTQPHTVSGFTFQPGTGWATGFMVSPSLFLTNNHVIPDAPFAGKVRVEFNYQLGPDGVDMETESYVPAAEEVFRTNPALDYTLVRLRPNQELGTDVASRVHAGDRWGYIPLNQAPVFRTKQHFNIVQHPRGRRKEVALQNNEIDRLFTNVVRYKADTEPGSSGSPVFDNLWQLVALHHAGGDRDASGQWLNNEGIRIDALITDLRDFFSANGREDVLLELGILTEEA